MNANQTKPPVRISAEAASLIDLAVEQEQQAGRSASRTSILSDLVIDAFQSERCNTCQSEFVVIQNGKRATVEFCPDCGFKL